MAASVPQKVRQYEEFVLPYSAGATKREKIAKGLLNRDMTFVLSGTLNTAANNLTAATLKPGGALGVIKKIRIMAGSSEVLWETTGEEVRMENLYTYGVPHRPAFVLGAPGTTFAVVFKIPFWKIIGNNVTDINFGLWSGGYSDVYVEVTWADHTAIDANATAVSANLTVSSTASDGFKGYIYQRRVYCASTDKIIGANPKFSIPLPVQVPAYHAFLVYAKAADGTDLGGKIDRLRLTSGPTVFRDLDVRAIRDGGAMDRGQFGSLDASGNPLPIFQDAQFKPDAWVFWNLCEDGYLTESEQTATKPQLSLEVVTNGAIANLYVKAYNIIPNTGFNLK